MHFDADPLAREGHAAHLPEQGRRGRRRCRRRWRMWLQLRRQRRDPGRRADLDPSAALIAAALALPGILPTHAHAQAAPDQGIFALRYYDYRDWQPGADRMSVRSPSLYALVPLSAALTVEGSLVHDTMSGASPLYHDTLSGASGLGVTDYRTAADVEGDALSRRPVDRRRRRVFERARLRIARGVRRMAHVERRSQSHVRARLRRGARPHRQRERRRARPAARDLRLPRRHHAGAARDGRRRVDRHVVGRPRLLFRSLQAARHRPDHRRIFAWLTRYNQYVPAVDATLRIAYRYLHDSFGDRSHMLEASWIQPLPARIHA